MLRSPGPRLYRKTEGSRPLRDLLAVRGSEGRFSSARSRAVEIWNRIRPLQGGALGQKSGERMTETWTTGQASPYNLHQKDQPIY